MALRIDDDSFLTTLPVPSMPQLKGTRDGTGDDCKVPDVVAEDGYGNGRAIIETVIST